MNSLVVYDSVFGNTEKVAKRISDSLDPQAKLVKVTDYNQTDLDGLDLLIVGSPTRAFNPTKDITDFLNKLPASQLKGMKIAAFDTRMTEEPIKKNAILGFMVKLFGYADKPIADKLMKNGAIKTADNIGFYVLDSDGPLKDGELDRADEWVKEILNHFE